MELKKKKEKKLTVKDDKIDDVFIKNEVSTFVQMDGNLDYK